MSSKKCAKCEKTVYPVEELKCLEKVWHKTCFKCQVCNMTLNMKNYKGFDKLPYCGAHVPKAKATVVADTPENARLAANSKVQSNVKYHAEFEAAKGKFTTIVDDPETMRLKANSDVISNIAYHDVKGQKIDQEKKRSLQGGGENSFTPEPEFKTPEPLVDQSNTNSGNRENMKQVTQQPINHVMPQPPPTTHHPQPPLTSSNSRSSYNPVSQPASRSTPPAQQAPQPRAQAAPPPYANPPQQPAYQQPPQYQQQQQQRQQQILQQQKQQQQQMLQQQQRQQSQMYQQQQQAQFAQKQQQQQQQPPYQKGPSGQYTQYPQQPPNGYGGGQQPFVHQPAGAPQQVARGQQGPPGGQRSSQSMRCYQAMYDYESQDSDEVSFRDGDIIINAAFIDEGWMTGTVHRTGQSGMLPANYVEPVNL